MNIPSDPFPSLLALRKRVAPPPDLLSESEQRGTEAEIAADRALGTFLPAATARRMGLYGITDDWPEPYGPDPVVFGRVPRVRP